MTRKFDIVVIGTGSAASAVASRCRSAGWQVVVIDSRPFGGTCAVRGCDPKKVLVGAAEAVDWIHRMKGKGIRAEELRIDWQELMRFKRSFTEAVPKSREEGVAKAGGAAFHGPPRLVSPAPVQGNGDVMEGRDVVIAAGEKQADVKIPVRDDLTTK